MTPLHWMTHGGHVDGMRSPPEHGANPNLQNVRGETPVDVAARMAPHGGQEELILLIEHGGKFARELGEAPPRRSPDRARTGAGAGPAADLSEDAIDAPRGRT